jgi:parallel beta-helix repeat protein
MAMLGALLQLFSQSYVTYSLPGPYDEDESSYYIKVRFVYLDNSTNNESSAWWNTASTVNTGGTFVLEEESNEGLQRLNTAFNPHGIYFFPDAPLDCEATPVYDAFAGNGLTIADLRASHQSPQDTLAFNIYVTGDGTVISGENGSPFDGDALSLPNNHLWVSGADNTGPDDLLVTSSATLVHEVGHALGLLHTFAGVYSDPPLSECDEATASSGNCQGSSTEDLCFCCGDYVCNTDPTSLTMILLNPDCSGSEEEIPDNIRRNYMSYVTPGECRNLFTEGQAKRMKQYLREMDGSTFSTDHIKNMQITETEFPDVTPSGVTGNFTVASGTLTLNEPLQMLPGATITVKSGAELRIQNSISSACEEMWAGIIVKPGGSVSVLGQGTIEDAVCAIDATSIYAEVTIFGGSLINNTIGFRAVEDFNPNPAAHHIFYGHFELNDQYKGASNTRPYFVVLRGLRGTRISGTDFRDNRTGDCQGSANCTLRAIGVSAEDAGFSCRSNSIFSKLEKGIEVANLGIQQGSFTVSDCQFEDNAKGISVMDSSSFLITSNTFRLDRELNLQNFNASIESTGVEISGESQGFTVSENTFLQEGSLSEDCSYFGTICMGTGQGLNNEIIDNDYVLMEVGNAARGNNGDEFGGVVYLCNDHSPLAPGISPPPDGCANYLVQPGATIRQIQHGESLQEEILPTGNLFSSYVATIKNGDENGQNFYNFTYYYQGDDADQNPGSPVGVDVEPLPDMPNCDEATCPPPCPEDPILIKARFQEFGFRADSLKLLAEVLTGNDKAAAEQASLFFRQLRNEAAGRVLQHYALDTTAVEADSLRQWLYNANTFGSLYLLAREQFFFGDTAVYQVLWERIPQLVDLTRYQASTYSDLSALFNILKPYLAEGGDLRELPKPLIEVLYGFTVHCNEAGFLSAALLQRNGVEATVPCNGQSPALAPKGIPKSRAQDLRRSESSPHASLFPNPTTGTLQVNLSEGADNASLILYNLQGQPAFQSLLTGQLTSFQLPVPPGIYLVRLQMPGQQPEYHKIIVSR